MRQRGESAAPRRRDRDWREGGRGETGRKEEEEVQKAPPSFSLSHRPPAQRTLKLSLSLSEIKGPLPAFYVIFSRAVRRRTAGLGFNLTANKFKLKVSARGAVV